MCKNARFRCVSHKFGFFEAKNKKSHAETVKNEENAKFYTPLCLDTLFCRESMMNLQKLRNLRKRAILKKNDEKPHPQLMKRTLYCTFIQSSADSIKVKTSGDCVAGDDHR